MKALRNYLNRIKPNFEPGGKLHSFQSVFDGFETFLYTPNTTSTSGVNIHDSLDSKRIMIIVVLALMPCLLFGMYNTGYQNWLAAGATEFPFWQLMMYGFLAVLPRIVVAYVVGLGIEFAVAQWRREEIQEGFLVTGILIPLICPVETPLWMLAVATAFSVIFVKAVFGGTGYMGRIHRAYPGLFRRDLDPVHPHRRGDTSRHRHSIMANHAECGCRRTAHGMDSQCVRDLDISGVVPVTA